MSKQNIEIVRAATEAFGKGDLDAALKDASADFEYDLSRANGPFRGVYGLDETRRMMREFTESWESVDYASDEIIDAGEHVVTTTTMRFQGRGGIDVQARPAFVWTIREGKLSRICMYQERDDALEAAGLTAEPD
jgi:ketosteroid isomerase-like protein